VTDEQKDPRVSVAGRLAQGGIDTTDRFVSVHDGGKMCTDHDTRYSDPADVPGQNYGIYAEAGDRLVILDVDDYDAVDDTSGLNDLAELREEVPTFEQRSAHDGDHVFYQVLATDDGRLPAAVLDDEFGASNPNPSWGEVRTRNYYVVGAGSQLDGCDKDWCDACADPDGGRYTVAEDREVATISADLLVETLAADPDLGTDDGQTDGDDQEDDDGADSGGGEPAGEVQEVLAYALNESDDDRLRDLWRGPHDDRSEAESALAWKLGFYLGAGRSTAKTRRLVGDVLDGQHTPDGWRDPCAGKWAERGEDYRESVLEAVDEQARQDGEHYQPGGATAAGAADGGAAVDTGGDGPDDPGGSSPPPLAPEGVMAHAFRDPYGRLSQSLDDQDPTVHELRQAETATYVCDLLDERGDDDVIGVTDGTLRAFDGGVWRRDEGEQRLREYGSDALRAAYSAGVLSELEEEVRARWTYHTDELGIDEPWLVLRDGTALNLETRETRDVGRDDLALCQIDAPEPGDAEPDLWLDFLAEVCASPDTIKKLQEYLGYCLWHHSQPYGKALFLVGPTDSGKGTVLKTIKSILGPENVASQSLQDLAETRWGPAHLHDKMVNIRNEITPGSIDHVEKFKELTGQGDTVSAEFKGEQKFEFEVTQKFLFATNQFPEFEDADGAFWNRTLFAKFPETIPEEDQEPEFHRRLLEERAGILNWMLDGLDRLRQRERFTGERARVDKQTIAEEAGDALDRFKQDALDISSEPTDLVHARDLYDLAAAYADNIDMSGSLPPWQGGAFTGELTEWPGVGTQRSRRITDESGDAPVYTGVRVDQELATELGVDVRTDDQTPGSQTSL
jgi:putative DNA primase/helicase